MGGAYVSNHKFFPELDILSRNPDARHGHFRRQVCRARSDAWTNNNRTDGTLYKAMRSMAMALR